MSQTAPENSPQPSASSGGSFTDFLKRADTWWSILILLFCFTAGCGIPFLWLSKAFKIPGKIVVTVLVTIYTIAILWVFFAIMAWAWGRISQAL